MASPSSRQSLAGAGWTCAKGSYEKAMADPKARPFSWLNPAPLWRSRNDRLARKFGDPTNDRRRAWMKQLGADRSLTVSLGEKKDSTSFLLAGDTGEGDASQYVTVPPLQSQADGADFLFICSDVIYPAGGIDEYENKFCRPYKNLDMPAFAVPGNHDWYDDCTGFMYWFCGQDQAPPATTASFPSKRWLIERLWHRAPSPDPDRLRSAKSLRPPPFEQDPPQPGPYFVLDTGPLLLVGIDTGIKGDLDQEQGEWLKRVSRASDKPKILVGGKPLYVDGEHHPGPIEGGGTVDHIVKQREHNYIAVLGGDIHNYQRYPARLEDGRTLMCLVTGGGGAFMHETHTIPNMDLQAGVPVSEADFRCYPLRGDSLSRFSYLYARKLRWVVGPLWKRYAIEPGVAAALMSERLRIRPTREGDPVEVSERDRIAASYVFSLHRRGRGALHLPVSEWLDWNQPPMFKQFLRVDAGDDEVRIRCFAASGCISQESDPPVEDDLLARRLPDGTWEWTLPRD
jgi:hypothetical protein